MTVTTTLKTWLNAWLAPANLRLDSRTADRMEGRRLRDLADRGHFDRPVFPVLPQFRDCDPGPVLRAVEQLKDRFADFARDGSTGFTFDNDYFTSPDAEVAYAMTRLARPKRILEVGSGYSTQLFQAAIRDNNLPTELISIDPQPRRAIEGAAHRIIRDFVENAPHFEFESLEAGDFLFIDSSHIVRAGSDVALLALTIVPMLQNGVIVHFHDIRLPYEYPIYWVEEYKFNEQYVIQALLQDSQYYEVLWPGHFLQRNLPDFSAHFPNLGSRTAGSLWLKINRGSGELGYRQ